MKSGRILLIVTILFCCSGLRVHAAVENIYEPDVLEMNRHFQPLEPLETILDQHPNFTMDDIQVSHDLNLEKISFYMPTDTGGALRQPFGKLNPAAFGVGFCCWPVGVVYILIKGKATKEEKNSYCAGVVSSIASSFFLGILDGASSFDFFESMVKAFSVF